MSRHLLIDGKPAELPAEFRRYRKRTLTEAARMDVAFEVETLEGTMRGKPGDYLMRGAAGELYPCDATIFAETYEAVDE